MFRHKDLDKKFIYKKIINGSTAKTLSSLLLVFLVFGNPVFALTQSEAQNQIDSINQQIGQLNQSLKDNQNQQQTLAGEISAIDSQVSVIQLQITQTADQISVLNSKIDELNTQISQAEDDLAKQKVVLGEYVKQMYIDGQTSQMQLILTSNNFSDFVDKSQYLNTMQQKVKDTVSKVESLKKELDIKKNDLEVSKSNTESLQAGQIAQRNAVNAQQNYKNSLLADAKSSASSLSKQKADLYAKKAALSAAFGETISGGSTSYPYGNPVPLSIADTPDAYGYYKGECTSYVAWKRSTIGKPIPPAIGNGGEWTGAKAGYTQSNIPHYGDVMVFPNLYPYGHVAFVEAVNGDGTVYISEYNWNRFAYDERTVNPYLYGAFFIH